MKSERAQFLRKAQLDHTVPASKSGSSFSILEAGLESHLESHFWGGGKSDLFTGSFFVDREEQLGSLHSGLQSSLGAQC